MKISRSRLRHWGKIVGKVLLGIAILSGVSLGLYHLGLVVTPIAGTGAQPVIYSPSVRQTENYRRQAQQQVADLQDLDAQLVTVLTSAEDIYVLSKAAQGCLETAADLDKVISLTYPPTALVSLQDGLLNAADQYLVAAIAVNHWVGSPTQENYLGALETIRLARAGRSVVETNPWLQHSPTTTVTQTKTEVSPVLPAPPEENPSGWGE